MMAFLHIQNQSAFAFGILGNIISCFVFLAPVKVFYKVFKNKSAEGYKSLPYLVALFSSMVWLYYALLKTNAMLLITINSFGCVVEIIYITIFVFYAPPHAKKWTMILFGAMNFGMFAVIVAITRYAVPDGLQVQVVGWIGVAVSISVFAAPLSIVAQVVRTRSIEFMPFTLSFFLTLSAVMWFAYGMFLKDICIAIPNVVGFVLGLIQMILYAIYKTRKTEVSVESAEKKIRSASSDQVYPVHIVTSLEIVTDPHPTHAAAA